MRTTGTSAILSVSRRATSSFLSVAIATSFITVARKVSRFCDGNRVVIWATDSRESCDITPARVL
jgi:hypothetical protein